MLLNVLKGTYLTLQQMDKCKLVSPDETDNIERGQLLYVDDNDEFKIADAAQAGSATAAGATLYLSLMGGDDLTAGMAGDVPTVGGTVKVNGIGLVPNLVIETDMFADSITTLNTPLTVGDDGIFVPHTNGKTLYGFVDAVPYSRWVNNAVAVPGYRTGANVVAIQVRTMYVPGYKTA